jgi:hypothetical protein
MLLTLFVISQIALDAGLALFLLVRALRRRAAPAPQPVPESGVPPSWYSDFLVLAEDLMTLVEPVLDAAENGRFAVATAGPGALAPAPSVEPRAAQTPRDRHRAALALLRAGTPPEEVARRERLMPGELRLMSNLVAAEAEPAGSRSR